MLFPRLAAVRRHVPVLLAAIVIQGALALIAARTWLARHNTLQANGRWRATKTELARGVMGAFAYYTSLQTLAGERLDLGAWHGFNEVLLREELEAPRRIEFDFILRDQAWLVVLLDRDITGRSAGLRLSAAGRYPGAWLEIAPDGEFLVNRTLARETLPKSVIHHADLRLEEGRLTARVDGELLASVEHAFRARQFFGLRGGLRPALVDNLVITLASGRRVSEDFSAPGAALWITAAALGLVVVVNLGVLWLLRRLTGTGPALGFRFLMVNLTLLALASVFYVFVLLRSARYPRLGAVLQASEAYHERGEQGRIREEIQERYGSAPAGDRVRILVVGSSQTWGAGASHEEDTFVEVLCARLERVRPGGPPFECINAGISGSKAYQLAPLLAGEWLRLAPRLVLINLSSNDRSSKGGHDFEPALEAMVARSVESGACPVLIKEANAHGTTDRGHRMRHAEMEEIGRAAGVPVIDMHRILSGYENRGFLWWDKVHLTSYGQRVVAEVLERELEGVLGEALAARR